MLNLNIAEFIIIAGSLQGIIFTFFLLLKSKTLYRKQNIVLCAYILIYSIIILKGWYIGSEYYLKFPDLLFLPLYFTFGIGPLFFIYINYLLRENYTFKGKQFFHLALPFIQFCYHFIIFIKPINERIAYFQKDYLFTFLPIEDFLSILSLSIYFFLSYRILRKFSYSIKNNSTEVKKVLVKWINNFIMLGYGMLIIWLVLFLIDSFIYDYNKDYTFYYPVYILSLVMMHWIMYKGFLDPFKMQPDIMNNDTNTAYCLPTEEVQLFLRKLYDSMEKDRFFLKPKLSLNELANKIKVNPKYLSQIINRELSKTFYDFINGYRVEFAKKELLLIKNRNITISAMSKNCGFNSKSTFNEVFKKYTLQTPTEFIKENT